MFANHHHPVPASREDLLEQRRRLRDRVAQLEALAGPVAPKRSHRPVTGAAVTGAVALVALLTVARSPAMVLVLVCLVTASAATLLYLLCFSRPMTPSRPTPTANELLVEELRRVREELDHVERALASQ